jgi:hypothetical protein
LIPASDKQSANRATVRRGTGLVKNVAGSDRQRSLLVPQDEMQIPELVPEIPAPAEQVLDLVSEDPEVEHVPQDVDPGAVHEHRAEQREIDRCRPGIESHRS